MTKTLREQIQQKALNAIGDKSISTSDLHTEILGTLIDAIENQQKKIDALVQYQNVLTEAIDKLASMI